MGRVGNKRKAKYYRLTAAGNVDSKRKPKSGTAWRMSIAESRYHTRGRYDFLESPRSWVQATLQRSRMESEMDSELRFHIETHVEELIRSGVPRSEAMRQARLEFAASSERRRNAGCARWESVESLIQDLRFGHAHASQNLGFTAVAVLTLALGHWANAAIFGLWTLHSCAAYLSANQSGSSISGTMRQMPLHTPILRISTVPGSINRLSKLRPSGWADYFYDADGSVFAKLGALSGTRTAIHAGVQPFLGPQLS